MNMKGPAHDGTANPDALADRHLAAVRALAELAQKSAVAQEDGVAALKRALASGDFEAARAEVDALWAELYPLFRAVSDLSDVWNDLAPAVTR